MQKDSSSNFVLVAFVLLILLASDHAGVFVESKPGSNHYIRWASSKATVTTIKSTTATMNKNHNKPLNNAEVPVIIAKSGSVPNTSNDETIIFDVPNHSLGLLPIPDPSRLYNKAHSSYSHIVATIIQSTSAPHHPITNNKPRNNQNFLPFPI